MEVLPSKDVLQSTPRSKASFWGVIWGMNLFLFSVEVWTGVEAASDVRGMVMFSSLNSNSGSSSFHSTSERFSAETFSYLPPTAPTSFSLLLAGSSSGVTAIVPCPESPATDPEWGSWSIINFHSSSWDCSTGLAPGRVSWGGSSGSSSQSSLSSTVGLLVVKGFALAALWAVYSL